MTAVTLRPSTEEIFRSNHFDCNFCHRIQWIHPVADPRPPLRTKIFLISCSFSENLANLYAGAPLLEGWRPLLRGILDPPLLNGFFLNRVFRFHINFSATVKESWIRGMANSEMSLHFLIMHKLIFTIPSVIHIRSVSTIRFRSNLSKLRMLRLVMITASDSLLILRRTF